MFYLSKRVDDVRRARSSVGCIAPSEAKYISEPFYPASCRKFSVPKSEPSEYGVEFHIRIDPDDPRRSEVRQAAQHIADAAEEVIRLDIRM